MKTVQMTLDAALVTEVDRAVKALGTTRSAFTRQALRAALARPAAAPGSERREDAPPWGGQVPPANTRRYVYYADGGMFIGWLEEFPDYRTQGETLEELKDNLQDIHAELLSGNIPCVRHIGELVLT